ncbi:MULTISPECIES: biotin/lipoyl-containing protein [unclassified Pseudonocardia]|uniref:acetyl-CoA carboxylase biotin carboxyl carrier protein n=1 Tax=unclassified Pseudonocardia TaxID=2619320 RepID=UPI0007616B2D|nr:MULTISPECIES: biotin/lipoyl-containing protein [unclassified Pseudonocardia]
MLLNQVRGVAERMLAGEDRLVSALRVRAGDVAVEMEWLEPAAVEAVGPPKTTVNGQAAAAERGEDPEIEPDIAYLTAHTVGCFYRSPSPDAAPFVDEGDCVSAGQQVAIIEAMKLRLPVEVDKDCRIGAVLAADGASVEFGDRLFALETSHRDDE